MSSSNKVKMHYVRGRGRAELIRFVMTLTGVEWEQIDVTESSYFKSLKNDGKLLFGQIPMIEWNGKCLVQSCAIARMFAKRGDLLGSNEEEATQIDILFCGTRDFYDTYFLLYGFQGWDDYLQKAKTVGIPKYLPAFEKTLKENGSNGFLVGSKLSLADVGLFETLLCTEEFFGIEELNPYPELKNFLSKMKSIESLANYLKGPQRFPKNDENYVKTCLAALFS